MAGSEIIWRELSAAELVVETVVVIRREDHSAAVTAWVSAVGSDFVAFSMGVTRTTFLAHLREDGTLADDTGRRILVWEYLGAV